MESRDSSVFGRASKKVGFGCWGLVEGRKDSRTAMARNRLKCLKSFTDPIEPIWAMVPEVPEALPEPPLKAPPETPPEALPKESPEVPEAPEAPELSDALPAVVPVASAAPAERPPLVRC